MTVTAGPGAWVVPPGRAVWVPAGMEHTIQAHGRLAMRTVYVAPDAVPGLPVDCFVVNVSPLLRELILAAMTMTMPAHDPLAGPEARLAGVLLDQIRAARVAPLYLPYPSDSRLRRVADGLIADPGDARHLAAWAKTAGTSTHTLARLFAAETAMSFRQWRQQVRLLDALRRLASGQPVTTVALDLGYESPSAFIAMFRKALGTTPGRYFD